MVSGALKEPRHSKLKWSCVRISKATNSFFHILKFLVHSFVQTNPRHSSWNFWLHHWCISILSFHVLSLNKICIYIFFLHWHLSTFKPRFICTFSWFAFEDIVLILIVFLAPSGANVLVFSRKVAKTSKKKVSLTLTPSKKENENEQVTATFSQQDRFCYQQGQ